MPDDYSMFTDPQGNTPGETPALIGSIMGHGLISRALTGFGALANRRAYEQFEQANRDKQLDLFERHGLISKDDRPYYKGLPTAAYEPIGQKLQDDLAKTVTPRAPTLFYNPATQQMEAHTLTEGQTFPKGLVTPGMYNAQQTLGEKQTAEDEHKREFGINKDIQVGQLQVANQLRKLGIDSNEAMRMATLTNTKMQQAFMDQMAKMRLSDQQQARFSSEESKLLDQQKNIATLQAQGKADPATIATLQAKQNAAMRAFKARAAAAGYETSSEFDPLSVQDKPGAINRLTLGAVGSTGSALVPPPAVTSSTKFKAGDRRMKNGKLYQRDETGSWHPVTP